MKNTKKALAIGLLCAVTPAIGMSAAGAAGTTNGSAGCVAQLNAVEGPPGQSIQEIKRYVSPVPGALVAAVARTDRGACELPR